MRKYLNVVKMVMLEKMQYIYNQIFKMIIYAVFIYMFLQLWKYLYSGENLIAGYTLNQMIWYFSFTEMIWASIRPRSLRKELSDDIRSGKIAYILNKPFNYISYIMSKYIGECIVGIFSNIIIGVSISLLIIGPLETFSIITLPFIIITVILSTFITGLIYTLISLSAFWIEENSPFFWIYEKFILVIGVIFPIEIFPKIVQPFIKFSPIYVTMYAPAKISVDFSFSLFKEILIFQIGYLIIMLILCALLYKKGVKKLNVNGG